MPSTLSDFEVLYTIGSGSYGTCKKVRRKSDGKIFVWKEMDYGAMTETEKAMLVSEVNLLRELKHEHIVKYHERVVDKKRQILYLIMEYCEGGDLGAVISRYSRDGRYFDEEMVWKTLAQCASALNECHKRKDGKSILHRDLKPANIFLDAQRNVKLGDFGLARVLHETSFAKTFVGTPYYMSPEQMNKLSYNEKSDIWSLGCVLYEMCTLRPPFLASNQRELALKIRMGQFSRLPSRYSSDLGRLIDKMLNVECNLRPSIECLLSAPQVRKYMSSAVIPKSGGGSGGSSTATTDMTKQLSDIVEREGKCQKMEAKLLEKSTALIEAEAKLLEKEAALKEKELRIENQEKDLSRRLSRVEERERKISNYDIKMVLKENGLHIRAKDNVNRVSAENEDDPSKPITPILCQPKKILDSPSKHVSFNMTDEKENDLQCFQSAITALREKEANLFAIRERERNNTEYQRRKELRDRLEKAKQRATQLKAAEIDTKSRTNILLNIR